MARRKFNELGVKCNVGYTLKFFEQPVTLFLDMLNNSPYFSNKVKLLWQNKAKIMDK